MIAINPLTDYGVSAPDPGPAPTGDNAGATMGASMGPSPAGVQANIGGGLGGYAGANIAALQGTPPLGGLHNVPTHVAALGVLALLVLFLIRRAGFGFSFAGNVGR